MPAYRKTAPSDSHVVTDDRFKILPVASKISIRDFVSKNGITFAPGRGFYQLTKPETIQAYKEIVAVRISDGTKITGDAVRSLLAIPSGASKFKYTQVPDFEMYVQSTSYNRVLMPGTNFLYEVNPDARGKASPKKAGISLAAPPAHSETRTGAPPTNAPGSPIDLVFSFDTTGSMYSCLAEVRKNLETLISRILTDIPNIRIAVFAQGDYCDKDSSYVTKFMDFSSDKSKLVKFVRDVESSGGGDFEECYELVLQEARTKLSWTNDSQRALVMIGDAIPHSVADYAQIKRQYTFVKTAVDWRKEADELVRIGCRVYAVQCQPGGYMSSDCSAFWQGLAYKTYGHHLTLKNFSNVFDFIMAIAYKEQGAEQFEAYRQEIIKRPGGKGMNADLHALFSSLAGGEDEDDGTAGAASTSAAGASAGKKRSASKARAPSAAKKAKVTSTAKKAATKPVAAKRKLATAVTATPAKKAKLTTKAATEKTATAKKTPAKKATGSKASAKKAPAKKVTGTKASAKKAPAKKVTGTKASAKKAPAKKATATKASPKKAPAKKAIATKPSAKKAPAKKTPVKKAPAKKTPAKKTIATKPSVKKAPAKKTPVKKAPAKNTPVKKAPAKKALAKKTPVKKAPVSKGSARKSPVGKAPGRGRSKK